MFSKAKSGKLINNEKSHNTNETKEAASKNQKHWGGEKHQTNVEQIQIMGRTAFNCLLSVVRGFQSFCCFWLGDSGTKETTEVLEHRFSVFYMDFYMIVSPVVSGFLHGRVALMWCNAKALKLKALQQGNQL